MQIKRRNLNSHLLAAAPRPTGCSSGQAGERAGHVVRCFPHMGGPFDGTFDVVEKES
jgi:hypothetical protein